MSDYPIHVNVKMPEFLVKRIDKARRPDETRSSAIRRLLLAATLQGEQDDG